MDVIMHFRAPQGPYKRPLRALWNLIRLSRSLIRPVQGCNLKNLIRTIPKTQKVHKINRRGT
jgi:hypothetical protein